MSPEVSSRPLMKCIVKPYYVYLMPYMTRVRRAMQISPLVPKVPGFGINVRGFDINNGPVSAKEKEQIIDLVTKYRYVVSNAFIGSNHGSMSPWSPSLSLLLSRIVVFKDQGIVPGERQVHISRWFGELESTFYKHPCSPHPDVFRVSNDPAQGCTGVGRTGWHVDGSFQPSPFSHALYHIIHCPTKGATVFLPLKEFLHSLPQDYRWRLERLSMLSDRRSMSTAKKVVYRHPVTNEDTMCFHLGMISGFVYDQGTSDERHTTTQETVALLDELERAIQDRKDSLWYAHTWEPGDFIISDNCAIAHEASIETQYPVDQVGLRVMHRTTTQGYYARYPQRQQLEHQG